MPPDRARQRVRFFDQYRSYVINYNLGQDLVRAYVESRGGTADRPDVRWREFTRLLASPRLPGGLEDRPLAQRWAFPARGQASRRAGSTSSTGSRRTTAARPSSGVGSRLTITIGAPGSAAATGIAAAGWTTSDDPSTSSRSTDAAMLERLLQDVRRQRLPEGHRGRLQDPAAVVARRACRTRRAGGPGSPPRARCAAQRMQTDAPVGAVQLEHALAAGLLVQAVDVLGDHARSRPAASMPRQRVVRRVGPRVREVRVRLLLVEPVAAARLRVDHELLEGNGR